MNDDLIETVFKPRKLKKLRIPYMGSKQKIAGGLLDEMLKVKPNAKYFVDLFAGGGSLSFTAMQYGLKVQYNELQTSLANFVKYTLSRVANGEKSQYGIYPKEWYSFVNREEFAKQKILDTPYSQFVRICYSFGNNQKSFAFCKNIEEQKRLAHNMVVFRCEESLKEFNSMFGVDFVISNKKTIYERRLDYRAHWGILIKNHLLFQEMIAKKFIKNHAELTSFKKKEWKALYCESTIESFERLEQLENLQNLERLEQLQNLQNLEQLEPLIISNLSYEDVKITTPIDETIIYCDPPYRGTVGYIEGKNFDYHTFDNWFANNEYSCFMSEYNAPHKIIYSIPKQKSLNSTNVDFREYVMENLYFNGKP